MTVDLWDCFSGPLDVVHTAELLEELVAVTVRGNHDLALVCGIHDNWNAAAAPHMPQKVLKWLATLPQILCVARFFRCQAIPQDDTKFWLETMQGGTFLRASLAHIAALTDVNAAVAPTLCAR